MAEGIRRIVTGHDASGKAVVISDGPAPNTKVSPNRPGVRFHNLWVMDGAPAKINGPAETAPADKTISLEPPKNGNNLRIVEFPPESTYIDKVDSGMAAKAFGEMGAGHALHSGTGKASHPFMHATKTVDYGIVLEGEIYLVLDDSEVLMKKNDICIQRGTNHAWSNRSDKKCVIAFILVDGE
jgi:mannose-6-phosphate isomerase-like protein (cupin superfamily)